MLFNTVHYLLFLPLVVLIYYILPAKVRYIWLLAVSYYFYMQWNPLYILLLFSCTVITYAGGRMTECFGMAARNKQKICLITCILINLGLLGFFKYAAFAMRSLNGLLALMQLGPVNWGSDILLPVGISFYILQSLGYLIDVYRGDIESEKNFLRYALFVSFFPQLVAGPIERSKNLLTQLHGSYPLRYENIRRGSLLVLYGLFLKMVIADRAAVIVDTVYGNAEAYPGFYVVVATVFFAIQIYCDFYGYTTVARGSALLMGIKLMDNFNAPYYAQSVKEFWQRWHISLSSWFRDYLYIPLGGNRKGHVRRECNMLTVFTVSGLWHGASWAFVFWGLLNGIYQVVENLFEQLKMFMAVFFERLGLSEMSEVVKGVDRFSRRLFRTVLTFALVTFAWLFFRAGGWSTACEVLKCMFSVNNWTIIFDGSLYELGVTKSCMNMLLVSIFLLFVVDYHKYQGRDVAGLLLKQGWYFKVLSVMFLIFAIMLYGCYGKMYDTQQFIYFEF